MALSSGYKKITRTQKQSDGNYKKISEWTSSTSVERDNGETIETSVSKLESDLSSLSKTVTNNKTSWGDKYTKNEIDNKFSTLETNIDWKESVATYSDIAKTYPNPADGWTVNVKDTDYTYRYNGTGWVAISANAIPKATTSVDGLLSKTDKAHYDDAYSKRHTHSNKSVIDGITSTLVNNWNSAKTHADSAHAPSDAQANVIETVKVNGTALTPSSKAVNVTVPTKVSQLTNDSGYKTTDNNTTYSLSKSGSTITLTGSDGSKTSVSDSDTNTWRGIQNNLTSTSTTDSLSAFMGKQLKSMIDTLITTGYYDTMWSNDAGSMNYYIRFSTGIMIMVTIIPDGWSVENNTHYIYPVSFINNNYALIAVDNTSTNGQTSGGFDRRIPMIRHERNYFTVWSNSVTPGDDNFYNEGIEDSMSVICIGRWK
jgi:hypothetical protein|nr:MAG TPA: Protein of unknown function (DUF2793) [Caudoviricetes sp.]